MSSPQPVNPEAVRDFAAKYPKALRALENLVRTLVHADPQHALQALNVTRRSLAYISDPEAAYASQPSSGAPLLLDSMSACMAATVRELGQTGAAPIDGIPQDGDVANILLYLQTSRDFSFENSQVLCHADDSLCSFGTVHNASLLDLTEQSLTLRSQGSSMRIGKGKRLRRSGSDVRSNASSAPTFGTQPSVPTPAGDGSRDDAYNMWSSMYNLAVVNASPSQPTVDPSGRDVEVGADAAAAAAAVVGGTATGL